MRTKNAKRLWPVPVTLGVMALAALLAFGLMATNGAQPAAAQDADCTVTVDAALDGQFATGTLSIAAVDDSVDRNCSADGDTATIEFVGPAGNPGDEGSVELYVLVEDKAGPLRFYSSEVFYQPTDELDDGNAATTEREANTFYVGATGTIKAEPMRYFEHNIMVPRAVRQGGRFNRQSTTISVQGEGTVHVYLPADYVSDIVADFANTDCSPACAPTDTPPTNPPKAQKFVTAQPGEDSSTVNITFLGDLSLGEDSDDRNGILDDFVQCVTTTAGGGFSDDTADPDGIRADCVPDTSTPEDVADTDDVTESRSKLVVHTGPVATPVSVMPVIGGGNLSYKVEDVEAVSIHAVLEDAKGNALEDVRVTFTATTMPSGIIATSKLSEAKDTATTDLTTIPGIDGETVTTPEQDAIATYDLDVSAIEGSYRIAVKVMAGDFNLGTINIFQSGAPETLQADVFNIECFEMGDEDDYSDATFNADAKDCDDSGMTTRYGAGDIFVVKAHQEDSLGNVVGEAGDMNAELGEDDSLLGEGSIVENDEPVEGKEEPRAWFFTIDEGAMLGDHDITVSTDRKNSDEEDIDDVELTISVAGEPKNYDVKGPAYIGLGDSALFTVTATDGIGKAPHITDENKVVDIFFQGLDMNNVRGLTNNDLSLDDEGMDSFTIYVPNGASNGDTVRIFIGDATEVAHTVTFGDPPPEPTVPGMPMSVIAELDAMMYNTINVSWGAPDSDGDSAITGYIIERRHAGDEMGDIPSDGYNSGVMGASHAFMDYKEWWETLNCKGMLAVADSSASDTARDMYCKHFPDTAPTNTAFAGSTVSEETAMKIKEMFMKRYVTDDMGKTMTMFTGMMYADTGLMASTEYTYRVSAVNSVGRSPWSDPDMATTGAAPTGPTGPMPDGTLAAVTLTVGDAAHTVNVVSAFTEADGDAVTYEAESDDTDVATVSVDGNIVSIMAEGAGSATVTVTATDKDDSATQTIAVTVSPSAVASYGISADPGRIAAGMIGTVTVTALDANSKATSGGTVRISLSGNIGMVDVYDLSNGELELGNNGMGDFRIFAKADATSGTVTVTVIGDQDLDTASGMVYIGPNRNPVGEAIADQTVKAGESVMVESNFTDPDGDTSLTYAWSSDDEEIATVMADETDMSKAAITGVASGMVTITVTATDSEGGEGMQSFMVTVSVPPMASGMLEDVTLKVGDAPAMVDVSSAFTEADGDDVTYAAESDAPMVATASADDMGMVTITPVGMGSATVSVTATDKDGASEAVTFMVTVAVAPVASYGISDPGRIEAGMTGTVTVTALDANGNATAGGTVGVVFSGDTGMVTIFDVTNNQLELGDDGMGSFRIFAKADATTGSVTVTVIGDADVDTANQMVYIGPEPAMDLGAPVMGTATSTTAGSATIMLTPGENATKHFVWAFPVGGTQGMYSGEAAGDAPSVTMTGLNSGTSYWFIAVAGRGEGDDAEWAWAAGWTAPAQIQ